MAMYSSQDLQNSSVHKDGGAAGDIVKKRNALNNDILEAQQPSKKQETVTSIKQQPGVVVKPTSELTPLRKLDLAEHEFDSEQHSPYCDPCHRMPLPDDADMSSSSEDEGPPHRFDLPRILSHMRMRAQARAFIGQP